MITHDRRTTVVSDEQVIRECVNALSRSRKGRSALKHVLEWLDDDGLLLDFDNRDAITTLLAMAWGGLAGTAREEMRAAISDG